METVEEREMRQDEDGSRHDLRRQMKTEIESSACLIAVIRRYNNTV